MQLDDAQSALSSKKLSKSDAEKNAVVNGPELVDMQSEGEFFWDFKFLTEKLPN